MRQMASLWTPGPVGGDSISGSSKNSLSRQSWRARATGTQVQDFNICLTCAARTVQLLSLRRHVSLIASVATHQARTRSTFSSAAMLPSASSSPAAHAQSICTQQTRRQETTHKLLSRLRTWRHNRWEGKASSVRRSKVRIGPVKSVATHRLALPLLQGVVDRGLGLPERGAHRLELCAKAAHLCS